MDYEYERGLIERTQASLEAVKVLDNAGFGIHDFDIDPKEGDVTFDLNLTLSLTKNERPLEE